MATKWAIARSVCMVLAGFFFAVWVLSLSLGSASGSRWKYLNRIELPVGSESSFVIDSKGSLYWGSVGLSRIQVYDRNGNFLRSWAAGSYGKPFEVVVDQNDRIFAMLSYGGSIQAFEADGTYLGRWTQAEFGKVPRRGDQQSFAGETHALGNLSFLWPSIAKNTVAGHRVTVVRQNLWRAILGVPFPCWPIGLLAAVIGVYCQNRQKQARRLSSQ